MKQKSFTLIELLVVIVIIGILAGVIVVSTSSAIEKANFAKAQAFSSTVKNELFSDLVSEWTFDDANNPAEDTGGNNNGTVVNATYEPRTDGVCVYGGCYSFNGTTSYINCGSDISLKPTKVVTMSFWMKPIAYNTVDTTHTLGFQNLNGYAFRQYAEGGVPKVFVASMNRVDSISRFFDLSLSIAPINQYTYFTIIFDGAGGKITVYSNGKLYGSKTVLTGDIIYSGDFYIGRLLNSFFDDVRVYNAALSSAQIKEQYLAGLDSLLSSNQISKEDYNQRIKTFSLNK